MERRTRRRYICEMPNGERILYERLYEAEEMPFDGEFWF